MTSPQRWPGHPTPPSVGFGASPPSFGAPPAQTFYVAPAHRPRRGAWPLALVIVLITVGAIGFGTYSSLAPTSCASGPPVPIQLNQVAQGELTTFHTRRAYELSITQPTQVMIAVTSSWDNYLELYMGSTGTPFLENDDGGGGRNALITTMLPPGLYTIVVRPYNNATGSFTLSVSGTPMGYAPQPVAPYLAPGAPMPQGYSPYPPVAPTQ